jgi:hypothetical protein
LVPGMYLHCWCAGDTHTSKQRRTARVSEAGDAGLATATDGSRRATKHRLTSWG